MKKIGLVDVKAALKDERFLKSLPDNFKEDLNKYLKNPACPCNVPFYRKLLKEAKDNLLNYYQDGIIDDEPVVAVTKNNWQVINCHISELESKLKALSIGRKQIAVTRYEDQVTCVINEVDLII